MQRIAIIITLLLAFSASANAQVLWGLKGGINVATLGTSSEYQPRLGYLAGLFYSQHVERQYGIEIGLQYSLQGARVSSISNARLSYHYLSLPAILKLYFNGPTYAEVGPQVAYLLGAAYHEPSYKDSRTDQVQRWDILGMLGIGYETDAGTNMGLRLGVGFLNTSGGSVGNSVVFRNLLLQAHIGIKLKEIE